MILCLSYMHLCVCVWASDLMTAANSNHRSFNLLYSLALPRGNWNTWCTASFLPSQIVPVDWALRGTSFPLCKPIQVVPPHRAFQRSHVTFHHCVWLLSCVPNASSFALDGHHTRRPHRFSLAIQPGQFSVTCVSCSCRTNSSISWAIGKRRWNIWKKEPLGGDVHDIASTALSIWYIIWQIYTNMTNSYYE